MESDVSILEKEKQIKELKEKIGKYSSYRRFRAIDCLAGSAISMQMMSIFLNPSFWNIAWLILVLILNSPIIYRKVMAYFFVPKYEAEEILLQEIYDRQNDRQKQNQLEKQDDLTCIMEKVSHLSKKDLKIIQDVLTTYMEEQDSVQMISDITTYLTQVKACGIDPETLDCNHTMEEKQEDNKAKQFARGKHPQY